MSDTPKFALGQLVKYKAWEVTHKDCPHCGQEMEEKGPEFEITTTVLGIETNWREPVRHQYTLKNKMWISEVGLEAA